MNPVAPSRYAFLVGAVSLLALYGPSLSIAPYADDAGHLVGAKDGVVFPSGTVFFRPIERLVNWANYQFFDQLGVLTILVSILATAALAALTYRLAFRVTGSNSASIVAFSLVILHPGNHSAISQIDTISQVMAALFALVALSTTLFGKLDHGRSIAWLFAACLLALLSKEIVIGLIAGLPALAWLKVWRVEKAGLSKAFACALRVGGVVAGVLLVYFILRYFNGSPLGEQETGRYQFVFEAGNILANVVFMLGALGYVGDTVELFGRQPSPVNLLGVSATLAWMGGLVLAVVGRRRDHTRWHLDFAWVLLGAIGLALFPLVLAVRSSEQYLITFVPLAALLVAMVVAGTERFWTNRSGLAGLLALVVLLVSVYTIMRKTEYRRDLSEFVNGTVAQFKEICSDSSGQDSDVCYLVSGAESRLNYSVYVHDEAWIVDAALNMLAVTKPTTTCVPDVVVECKDEGTTIRSVQPCARGWLDRHSPRF